MRKAFCIGFPKTGTTSLEEALSILGYNVCKGHYNNNHTNYLIGLYLNKDFKEIDRIIGYFDAFADLPWGGTDLYIYLTKKYPDAIFIHTERDVHAWYRSFENMLTKLDRNLDLAMESFHRNGRYGLIYYLESVFNIQKLSNNKEYIINQYEDANRKVRDYFENSDYSYLNMDITQGEGWDVLCPFLNTEIVKTKFPSANSGLPNPINKDISKKSIVDFNVKSKIFKTIFKRK